jgi:hypothetical protein
VRKVGVAKVGKWSSSAISLVAVAETDLQATSWMLCRQVGTQGNCYNIIRGEHIPFLVLSSYDPGWTSISTAVTGCTACAFLGESVLHSDSPIYANLPLHELGWHLHRVLDGDHARRLEEVELLLAAEVFVDAVYAASQVLRSV